MTDVEAVARALWDHVLYDTDYEAVPYAEKDRARYLHLKQRVERVAQAAIAAYTASLRERGMKVVPLKLTKKARLAMAHELINGTSATSVSAETIDTIYAAAVGDAEGV